MDLRGGAFAVRLVLVECVLEIRADSKLAVITDSIAAAYAIEASKLPLVMTEDYLSHIQKGFPFKKGKPNLVKAVNKALADMIADGTYAKLTTELVGYSPAPKDPIRTIF